MIPYLMQQYTHSWQKPLFQHSTYLYIFQKKNKYLPQHRTNQNHKYIIKFPLNKSVYVLQKKNNQNQFKVISIKQACSGQFQFTGWRFICAVQPLNISYKLYNRLLPSVINKDQTLPKQLHSTLSYSLEKYTVYKHPYLGQKLQQMDMFKFERNLLFRVIGIYTGNKEDKSRQYFSRQINYFNNQLQEYYCQQMDMEGSCKICLCSQAEEGDFLISPCVCKGSCEYVHYKCLTKWIENKIVFKSGETQEKKFKIDQYKFKKYFCEICRYNLPRIIVKGKKHYPLFNINYHKPPYIILYLYESKHDHRILIINPSEALFASSQNLVKKRHPIALQQRYSPKNSRQNLAQIIYYQQGKDNLGKFYLNSETNETFLAITDHKQFCTQSVFAYQDYFFEFKNQNQ